LEPDIVVLAKALSGGLVPVGAVLLTDDVYNSVYGSLKRAIIHTSTFSENNLAMRTGLATLDVLESEGLGARALSLGKYLRQRLQAALASYEMVKEVRGLGLFCGIEFQAPRSLALRASFEAFMRIHPGMFGQMLVMQLFRNGILTQVCGNNFLVLKVAPPLVVLEEQVDQFVSILGNVVESIHTSTTFWSEALGLARRVASV
jgi:ornithine--oxo-acid transaminase